ncbi:N-acetyltransferase [Syntrophomonas curvata]
MIREAKKADTELLMDIWLKSAVKTHDFIPQPYWMENYTLVKEQYIPMAKTFVYQDNYSIRGFISIIETDFIGALFVDVDSQGKGIGTELLDFVQDNYTKLSLAVYKENIRALAFYKKRGFHIAEEQLNESNNEIEYIMYWKK